MSLITYEYLVAQALESTLRWVKDNPFFIDLAIVTHRNDLLENLRTTLVQGKIQVVMEYSWRKPSFPAYIVFLDREIESHQHVGDDLGETVPILNAETEEVTETLTFQPFPRFVLSHFPVVGCKILCDGREIPFTDFTLDPRRGRGTLLGEYSPQSTYTATYTYFSYYQEQKGSLFNCTLRIDTVSNNFDECLLLHRFLIYLLMSMRPFLSSYGGLKNQVIASELTDVYMEDTQPEPLYIRPLRFSFDVVGYGIIPLNILRHIEIYGL